MSVDSLIDMVTGELADVFNDVRSVTLVKVGVSDLAAAVPIDFEFVMPNSCTVYVLDGMLVDVPIDTLGAVFASVRICVVSEIGVDVLVEANIDILPAVTIVEFTTPEPLEKSLYLR